MITTAIADRAAALQAESQRFELEVRASLSMKAASYPAGTSSAIDAMVGQYGDRGPRNAADQYAANLGVVYTAVRTISQQIAGQPIRVARKATSRRAVARHKAAIPEWVKNAAGDDLELVDRHLLLDTLADPSPIMTGWDLKYVTIASMELTGRALWWIADGGNGKWEINFIPTHWIHRVSVGGKPWEIQPPGFGEPFKIPSDFACHFHYPRPDDPLGCQSPLQALAKIVTADAAIEDCQYLSFAQGIRPSVIIKAGRVKGPTGGEGMRPHLTTDQKNQLITAIKSNHQGVRLRGEPIIVDGMIEDVVEYGRTNQELDFLSSAKMTRSRIMQGFGVNAIVTGEIEGANRASATEARRNFFDVKINPLAEMLSASATAWLGDGPPFAMKGEKLIVYIEPCRAKDEEMDLKKWAAGKGTYTVNEYRTSVLDLPPIAGGDELTEAGPATAAGMAEAEKWFQSHDPYSGQPLALEG